MIDDAKTLKIALLGCGSVGSQVARLLREHADDLALRTGARLELAGIAVRRPPHPRDAAIARSLASYARCRSRPRSAGGFRPAGW